MKKGALIHAKAVRNTVFPTPGNNEAKKAITAVVVALVVFTYLASFWGMQPQTEFGKALMEALKALAVYWIAYRHGEERTNLREGE